MLDVRMHIENLRVTIFLCEAGTRKKLLFLVREFYQKRTLFTDLFNEAYEALSAVNISNDRD